MANQWKLGLGGAWKGKQGFVCWSPGFSAPSYFSGACFVNGWLCYHVAGLYVASQ